MIPQNYWYVLFPWKARLLDLHYHNQKGCTFAHIEAFEPADIWLPMSETDHDALKF